MKNYSNTDEFATRKFDLDEIAKAESEKDFSLNPEAKKFYGESYFKQNEKPDFDNGYSQPNNGYEENTKYEESPKKPRKNKALIAAGVVFAVGVVIFMVILIKMTYRNDVFYHSEGNNEIELERQEPKTTEEDDESELLQPPKEQEKEPAVTKSPYKSSVGNYIFTSSSPEMGECTYNVYVSNVSDDGTILFAVALMNEDSTVMYETGTITASLNGNKAEFNWGDNHGNSGIGELELLDNSVSIMLIENETAGGNTASLSTDNPITIQKAN